MPTYVTTIKFTAQGIQSVKDTTKRANAFKSAAKKLGVKVQEVYWTLGAFDGLLVLDAPDDETVTAAMLRLGAQGNVHTQTARAYKAAEMDKVLEKMGG
jgi:uncharacterized protein with GYD domain